MEQPNYILDDSELFDEAVHDVISQFFYIRPGIIESFNPVTNRATAVIAIKAKRIFAEEVSYVTAPLIENVPISLPYSFGSGMGMTVPILKGDPCTLLFSDRMMDVFIRTGQFSPPEDNAGPDNVIATPRMHHMADAILVPGLLTSRVGAAFNILANWNQDHIELRDRDRKNYVSVGNDGAVITDGSAQWTIKDGTIRSTSGNVFIQLSPDGISMSDGTATWNMNNGQLSITAPSNVDMDTPNLNVSGNISAGGRIDAPVINGGEVGGNTGSFTHLTFSDATGDSLNSTTITTGRITGDSLDFDEGAISNFSFTSATGGTVTATDITANNGSIENLNFTAANGQSITVTDVNAEMVVATNVEAELVNADDLTTNAGFSANTHKHGGAFIDSDLTRAFVPGA